MLCEHPRPARRSTRSADRPWHGHPGDPPSVVSRPGGCRRPDIPLTESVGQATVCGGDRSTTDDEKGAPRGRSRPGGRQPSPLRALRPRRRRLAFACSPASMRRRRFRRNEVIFHQGDIGDSLHIVVAGGVKIVLPSHGGRGGDHRQPQARRLLRRAGAARRLPTLDDGDRARADRDARAPARPVPAPPRRGSRARHARSCRPGRRAASPDRPRGGAPLPRPGGPARDAPRAPGPRQRSGRAAAESSSTGRSRNPISRP